MIITKGVIAAAGRGTRFLPGTKVLPKELLPIVDKPIIQHIVEEFVAAGIREIVVVVADRQSLIEKHFRADSELENYLAKAGKRAELEKVRKLPTLANITFVPQIPGPYGNGTACLSAREAVGDEPFVFAFGDDLVLARESFTRRLVEAHRRKPGIYVGVQEVAAEEVIKYGIVKPKAGVSGEIASLIEKPQSAAAPSRLAVFGRYLVPPEIFGALEAVGVGRAGEVWFLDAVRHLIEAGHQAYYKEVKGGQWYTTGDPVSYLRAVRAFALARPELHEKLKDVFIAENKT